MASLVCDRHERLEQRSFRDGDVSGWRGLSTPNSRCARIFGAYLIGFGFDDRCSHRSLAFVRKAYVEHVQAGMVFGGRKNAWQDVEVDETSFDKKLVPMDEIEVPERNMKGEQWVGMVQRGKPTSLVLLRLSPKLLGSSSDVTNCNEPLHA